MFSPYRWSFLHITDLRKTPDNKGVVDEDIALLAGQMEAYLTAPLIRMHWQNTMGDYCASPSDYCTKLQDFIGNSVSWMNTISGVLKCRREREMGGGERARERGREGEREREGGREGEMFMYSYLLLFFPPFKLLYSGDRLPGNH